MRAFHNIIPLIILLRFTIIDAQTAEFEVTGVLDYAAYNLNGSVLSKSKREFRVSVKGCKSIIRVTDPQKHGTDILYWEVATDDADTYQLTVFDPQYDGPKTVVSRDKTTGAETERTVHGTTKSINVGSGSIQRDPVPPDDASFANAIWLAYSSACYLKEANGKVKPIWSIGSALLFHSTYTVPAEWEPLSGSQLPAHIVFWSDGNLPGLKGSDAAFVKYNEGFTNALYVVNGTKRVNGLTLPAQATLTRYAPIKYPASKPEKHAEPLYVLTEIQLQSDTFSPTVTVNGFKPLLTGVTAISDRRFYSHSPPLQDLHVYSTNWPTDEELAQTETYKRYNLIAPFTKRTRAKTYATTTKSIAFMAIVALLALSFGGLGAWKLATKRSSTSVRPN